MGKQKIQTMDLTQYRPLIERLKPLVNKPGFDEQFKKLTVEEDTSTRFLLKMELKRLAAPCVRVIDLREQSEHPCFSYDYQDITHYLDEPASIVFEQGVATYGQYCMGVYEDVMASVRRRSQTIQPAIAEADKAVDPQALYTAEIIPFGTSLIRDHERLNYAMSLKITLADGQRVNTITSDISEKGLRLRLPLKHTLTKGDKVIVDLSHLAQRYTDTEDSDWQAQYNILGIYRTDTLHQWVGLQLDDDNPALQQLVASFIQRNKTRFRTDTDTIYKSARIRGYEHGYLLGTTTLPVFVSQRGPELALLNEVSESTWQYWLDNHQHSQLGNILTAERLQVLQEKAEAGTPLLLYSFTFQHQDTLHFYTGTTDELRHADCLELMLGYASRRHSFRVFQLTWRAVSAADAIRPPPFPESVQDKYYWLSRIPEQYTSLLNALTGIVVIEDITPDETQLYRYRQRPLERGKANQLQQFENGSSCSPPQPIWFQFVNRRSQERYILRLPINIHKGMHILHGMTRNLSATGLHVELTAPYPEPDKEIVTVDFPDFKRQRPKLALDKVQYRLIAIDSERRRLSLQLLTEENEQAIEHYISSVLTQNADQLKTVSDVKHLPELAELLRNLYSVAIPSLAALVTRQQSRWQLTHVGIGQTPSGLLQIFKDRHGNNDHSLQLAPLFNTDRHYHHLIRTLKINDVGDKPLHAECLLATETGADHQIEIIDYLPIDEATDTQKVHQFVQQAGEGFYAIRITLSRIARPELPTVQSEMSFLQENAIHQAQELEQELLSLVGVGDISDITEELQLRYQVPQASPSAAE